MLNQTEKEYMEVHGNVNYVHKSFSRSKHAVKEVMEYYQQTQSMEAR